MIEECVLRSLILEVFRNTPRTQISSVINDVEKLVAKYNLFPTEEACREAGIDYHYYGQKELNPIDKDHIVEITWGLIVERVLTPNQFDRGWPFLRLTSFGQNLISESVPHYYDPLAYIQYLKGVVVDLDPVIEQTVVEGLNCFRQQLFFASAVMIGAAAEKATLLLLEAIANALTDAAKKKEALQLLERGRLPSILGMISGTLGLEVQKNVIPYEIHQGCTEHLVSLFEMIRVQRNDAVHPKAGKVDRNKVFLSIHTLPAALQLVYSLSGWLKNNPSEYPFYVLR